MIIGEQSYGKGTVQNLLDLDRFINSDENEKPGELKMTLAKFYRVTGSSTQQKGVLPDIELPSPYSSDEYGESSEPSALPWDLIQPTRYQPMNYVDEELLSDLVGKHEIRMKSDSGLIDFSGIIDKLRETNKKTDISLNYEQRKLEQEEEEKLQNVRLKLSGTLTEGDLPSELRNDTEVNDPYLKEGLNVIADWLSYRIG